MLKTMTFICAMFCLSMATLNVWAETSIINVYDANGNLVSGDGRYYEYNDANQLVRVRQGDSAGAVIAEYVYDHSGQRVKKVENGVVTYYVGKHYEKQVGGTNEGATNYYFGAAGQRVAKKDPAGTVYFYHLDHLDSVNVVTNAAGTQVARADFLPFGDVREGSSTEKYSYTDKERDKTDLYYFDARYNSPEFRHFTQADIAEPDYSDPQDLNRYAYVGNNPLSYVDDDGFKKKKKSKKKAKLSKREKWMIAHGVDPDHDKTPLKKAKKLYKEGKKYKKTASNSNNSFLAAISSETRALDANSTDLNVTNNEKNYVSKKNRQSKVKSDLLNETDFEVLDFILGNIDYARLKYMYEGIKLSRNGIFCLDGKISGMDFFEEIPFYVGDAIKSTRMLTEHSAYYFTDGKIGAEYSLHQYYNTNPLTGFISKSTEYLFYYMIVNGN